MWHLSIPAIHFASPLTRHTYAEAARIVEDLAMSRIVVPALLLGGVPVLVLVELFLWATQATKGAIIRGGVLSVLLVVSGVLLAHIWSRTRRAALLERLDARLTIDSMTNDRVMFAQFVADILRAAPLHALLVRRDVEGRIAHLRSVEVVDPPSPAGS